MRQNHLLAGLKSMCLLGTLLCCWGRVSFSYIPLWSHCCSVSPTWTITAEIQNGDDAVKFVFRSELLLFQECSDSRFSFILNYTLFQLHLPILSLCDRPHHNITPSVSAVGYYLHATINITVRNYNLYQYFTEAKEGRQWKEIKFHN